MTLDMQETTGVARGIGGTWLMGDLARAADIFAVGIALSLPWSTSVTWVFLVLWLVALLPTLGVATIRQEVMTPAGGMPVLLFAMAVVGMLWADANWSERLQGLSGFHKLLIVPLLLAQFRRSDRGMWVLAAFLISAAVLVAVSWGLYAIPDLPWRGKRDGIPVKDYISQSGIFAICALVLMRPALDGWRAYPRQIAVGLLILIFGFLTNIAFVATGRTALVVIPVLLLMFALCHFRWYGVLGTCVAGLVAAGALWTSSDYLRGRVMQTIEGVEDYYATGAATSAGDRLEFYKKSVRFVASAPILGNGTGSIPQLFRESVVGDTGAASLAAVNPHNQIFTVAIQLGLVGVLMLAAMWIAHLALFRGSGLVSWIGLVVVTQNIVSSLFNSHLLDFTQGWIYVFGVAVAGAMARRALPTGSNADPRNPIDGGHDRP